MDRKTKVVLKKHIAYSDEKNIETQRERYFHSGKAAMYPKLLTDYNYQVIRFTK